MKELRLTSPDVTDANIDVLAEHFPSVMTEVLDGAGNARRAVDFDLLRQALSGHVVEGPQERYQLDWPGKRAAAFAANDPIAKTLRPVREDSACFDATRNLFIQGENLEVLKLIQESYLSKVRVIYIDPPYNTGNDFIYRDDFAEDAGEYLRRSGQLDGSGARLVANPDSSGRFHSAWLSMLYPRLKLARRLLADDGVLFVSIDDHELNSVVALGREVFGEDCHLGTLTWLKKRKGSFLTKGVVSMHEYVVAFGRRPRVPLFGGVADAGESQPLVKRTNARATLRIPGGLVETKLPDGSYPPGQYGQRSSCVELHSELVVSGGLVLHPFSISGPFVWSQSYLDEQIRRGARLIVNTINLQLRAFKAVSEDGHKGIASVLDGVRESATNEDAYEYASRIFEAEGVLDYPKPVNLIKILVAAATASDKKAIVLDFFAGSGTTADAVMRLNAEDGGERRFILVQLAEPCPPDSAAARAGFADIAEIAKERIRRAVRLAVEDGLAVDAVDTGFRVLVTDTSNMLRVHRRPDDTSQQTLEVLEDTVKPGRSGEDLLFEVLLSWGLEPDLPIAVERLLGHEVFVVEDDALIACFDAPIDTDLLRAVAERTPLRAVFRDSNFASDAARIGAVQIFREFAPATDLRTI